MLQRMEAVRLSGYNQLADTNKYPASTTQYFDEKGKTNGNGGRAPARTMPTFIIESGMNPVSVTTMNHAAMKTNIQRSIACARGVPERTSDR